MKFLQRPSVQFALLLGVISLSACSTRPVPDTLPSESAAAPSIADFWLAVEQENPDNWFYLLNEGPSALDWRLSAIDSARQSIDLQSFLWNDDVSGKLVVAHLVAAADRGVQIRILMDDTFILSPDDPAFSLQTHPNISYRAYNPFQRRNSDLAMRQILNLGDFHRLDHRMHNKSMTVDNRVSIVGGRNLADEYFGLHGVSNFRDMELIASGNVVLAVSNSFDNFWNSPWSIPIEQLANESNAPMHLDQLRSLDMELADIHEAHDESTSLQKWIYAAEEGVSGEHQLLIDLPAEIDPELASDAPVQLASQIIELMDAAEREIVILSAYLIPTLEFGAAIDRAISRGVEVYILTNSIGSNNHLTAHSAYRRHIRELLDIGAYMHELRIDALSRGNYMTEPTEDKSLALHAKVMIIDESKVFIGSANFDPRSLNLNTELGLVVHSEDLGTQILSAVATDFSPENAWILRRSESGNVQWVSSDKVLDQQPAQSFMQRIEDWFFSKLPIEGEL